MLHLDARVHLDEEELALLVEEFERAGPAIAHCRAGAADPLAHLAPLLCGDSRCRRFLDDLLPPPLQRAVALAQRDDVAVMVAHHLELDMPRQLEEFLHVDGVVGESGQRLCLGDVDGAREGRLAVHYAHAAATAATRGLDDHRVADGAADPEALVDVVGQRSVRARHAGHAGLLHHLDGGDLVAEQADGLAARADKDKTALFDTLGEVGVFGQEAVARMDGDRVGHLGGADDGRHVEVAVLRLRRPDAHRLVGEQHVLEALVGGRVDRYRLDAQFAAGAQDTQRDLAAVGDDDLLEHCATRRRTRAGRTRPARRCAPARTPRGPPCPIRSGSSSSWPR